MPSMGEWLLFGIVGTIAYFSAIKPMMDSSGYMRDKRVMSSMDAYAQQNGPYDRRVSTFAMNADSCVKAKI